MKAAALRLFFLLLSFTVVKKYKYRFDTQLTLESHSNYQFGSKLTLGTLIWPRKSWWLLFHSFWRGTLEITNIFKSVSSSVWSLVFLKPLFRDKYSDCLREKLKKKSIYHFWAEKTSSGLECSRKISNLESVVGKVE